MGKRPAKANPKRWRIERLGGRRAEYRDVVVAPTADAALERYCRDNGITDPHECARLVAREILE